MNVTDVTLAKTDERTTGAHVWNWKDSVFLLLPSTALIFMAAYSVVVSARLKDVTDGESAVRSRQRADANEAEFERKILAGELQLTKEKTVEMSRRSHRAASGVTDYIRFWARFIRAWGVLLFIATVLQVYVILRVRTQYKKPALKDAGVNAPG
jgi:hypothetical protein